MKLSCFSFVSLSETLACSSLEDFFFISANLLKSLLLILSYFSLAYSGCFSFFGDFFSLVLTSAFFSTSLSYSSFYLAYSLRYRFLLAFFDSTTGFGASYTFSTDLLTFCLLAPLSVPAPRFDAITVTGIISEK